MFLLSTACSVSANLLPTEVLTASRLQIEGEGVVVGGGQCLGKMSHSIEIVMCLILSAPLPLRDLGFLPSPALNVTERTRCKSSVILGMRKR